MLLQEKKFSLGWGEEQRGQVVFCCGANTLYNAVLFPSLLKDDRLNYVYRHCNVLFRGKNSFHSQYLET